MASPQTLNVGQILMGLAGGLSLFLFGMEQMTKALKQFAGGRMKNLLAKVTKGRFRAVAAGAFVTAVIQSSSVTTVLLIGFISAGLLTLQQSIGVIMGASIGTTITAQIIAFKITQYALLLVAIGFVPVFFSKNERLQNIGALIMGLGLVLFGMELMSQATRPLRTYSPFISLMQQMANPLMGILIGAVFTAIIQSSSATTGVVIVLAGQGLISLEAGILLCFGANIGTCVTALIAAIGKQREAVQAAVFHVLFKVLGVLLWIFFVPQLASLTTWISPTDPNLVGVAKLSYEAPRQIANAYTIFNVANTLVFIWFTAPMAWLVQLIVRPKKSDPAKVVQPKYLDDLLLDTPILALDRVRMEMRRLGERAYDMVEQAMPAVLRSSPDELKTLSKADDEIDTLHGNIVTYLGKLLQTKLKSKQSQQLQVYMNTANYIEGIGDLIETEIVASGLIRVKKNLIISPQTQEVMERLHAEVCQQLQLSLQAFDASDIDMASQVLDAKNKMNRLTSQAKHHLAQRLITDEKDRLELFRLESELIDYLKRVYYFSSRIARSVLALNGHTPQTYSGIFEAIPDPDSA